MHGPSVEKLERKLDETYTRMLRVLSILNWKTHPTINRLYGQLSRIFSVIRERRTQYAIHCYRRSVEVISDVILWDPKHATATVGRPVKTDTKLLVVLM